MDETDKNIILKLDKFLESRGMDENEKIAFTSKMLNVYINASMKELTISDHMDSMESDSFDEEDGIDELLDDDLQEEEPNYYPQQPLCPEQPLVPMPGQLPPMMPLPPPSPRGRGRPPKNPSPPMEEKPIGEMTPEEMNQVLQREHPHNQVIPDRVIPTPPRAPTGAPIIKRPKMKLSQEDVDRGDY